jgi:hypothetical protein
MTIEKKSLISTLKSTKKANAVKDSFEGATVSSVAKAPVHKAPVHKAPVHKAPVNKAPVNKVPVSKAPVSKV